MSRRDLPGLGLALGFGFLASLIGGYIPLLGASLLALVMGLLISLFLPKFPTVQPGLGLASKKGLQYSIILLGFRLSFSNIQSLGVWSLGFSLPFLLLIFGLATLLGSTLGLSRKQGLLIAFGTAICGGSAIASAAPILEAEEEEVGLALATIFIFNLLALLVFPLLGTALTLPEETFGIWAGLAINDTSSVVAAGYGYSQTAGDVATVVKLARTLLIVPTCLGLALSSLGTSQRSAGSFSLTRIFPTFILWFLLASLVTSLGLVPKPLLTASRFLSQWLMAASLFGVGAKLSLKQIKQAGLKPILFGGLLWLVLLTVSLTSLLLVT